VDRTPSLFVVVIAVVVLLAPRDAAAYLDPGTGGILLQGLLAALVAGLVYLRSSWRVVKRFFARLMGRADDDPQP
jgi:hypothetical protein